MGAASGFYESLPISDVMVKTNDASLIGKSSSTDFTLLNGAALHAGQLIWIYLVPQGPGFKAGDCVSSRIQFQADSYGAMVEGAIGPGCNGDVYFLNAMAQQRMTVFVFKGNLNYPLNATVTAPDGTNIQMSRNEVIFDGILATTGDYTINLIQDNSEPEPLFPDKHQGEPNYLSDYTLLVVIR